MMKCCVCTLFLCVFRLVSFAGSAEIVEDYFNPLDVLIGDPQIFKDSEIYYLYGTIDGEKGFEVFSSPDLASWRRHGFCFTKDGKWAQHYLWAPETIRAGNTYRLFYTGSDNYLLQICVASSDFPLGPFQDIAAPMYGGSVNHFDPSPFYDEASERYYLFFTKDTTQSGSDRSEIWGGRLAPDFKSFDVGPFKLLEGDQSWELMQNGKYFIEGPNVKSRGAFYYMQYSGSAWNTHNYALGYATARAPLGPFTKFFANPILKSSSSVFAPGHGCFVSSPDGTEDFIVYHSHLNATTAWRQLNIDRMDFIPVDVDPLTPDRLEVFNAPTNQASLLPSGAALFRVGKSNEFSSDIDRKYWHIMNEDSSGWEVSSGALHIRSKTGNVFLQYAPQGDFAIETKAAYPCPIPGDAAFLMVFQDHSNFLKIMKLNRTNLKMEIEKQSDGVVENYSINDPTSGDYYFRIVKTGNHYEPMFSDDGTSFTLLGAGYDVSFNKQIQVGIGAQSPFNSSPPDAPFDYFHLTQFLPAPIGVNDEFTGAQLDRNLWLVHQENPGTWSFSGGALNVITEEGDIWENRRNARNLFLQKAPDGDFEIKTKISFMPQANYEQAILLVWADHDNYIKLSSLYDNGLKLEAATESNGIYDSYFMVNTIGATLYLKIGKTGSHYDFYFSLDDLSYTIFGTGYNNPMNPCGMPVKIGLGAMAPQSGQPRNASFDFFRVETIFVTPTPTPTPTPTITMTNVWECY